MSSTIKVRSIAASGLFGVLLAAGSAMLSPPGAADMQPLLRALGIVSCTSSGPCEEYDNTGQGSGLKGTSSKGAGLTGVTNYNKSGATSGTAGVSGTDTALKTNLNSGVLGTATMGTGVTGISQNNVGVSAASTNNFGVFAVGGTGGVFGQVTSFNDVGYTYAGVRGIDRVTNTNINAGVWGDSTIGTGVEATSQDNYALSAFGHYGAAIYGDTFGLSVTGSGPAIEATSADSYGLVITEGVGDVQSPLVISSGVSGNPFADAFESFDSNGTLLMKLTNTGDISILGQIFTSGLCNSGCITHRGGGSHRVVTYAPTEAEPTREDSGSAQLVGGKAYVKLDPAFVNVINASRSYLVFLTPEGDSRGLYVTGKSADGFTVRESMGGTSTLAFDYCIVAKPFGISSPRLPMVTVPQVHLAPAPRPTHRPRP